MVLGSVAAAGRCWEPEQAACRATRPGPSLLAPRLPHGSRPRPAQEPRQAHPKEAHPLLVAVRQRQGAPRWADPWPCPSAALRRGSVLLESGNPSCVPLEQLLLQLILTQTPLGTDKASLNKCKGGRADTKSWLTLSGGCGPARSAVARAKEPRAARSIG